MTDSRLAHQGVEAIVQTVPASRVAHQGVEAIITTDPQARVAVHAIEVMIPVLLSDASYSGWGIKL